MQTDPRTLLARVLAEPQGAAALTPEEALHAARQAAELHLELARRAATPLPRVESAEPGRLLTPDEAAVRLGVTRRWLYDNAKRLPFARKLSRKMLRFHEAGLERYIREKRP